MSNKIENYILKKFEICDTCIHVRTQYYPKFEEVYYYCSNEVNMKGNDDSMIPVDRDGWCPLFK